jgi:hypothetical protein
MPRAGARLHAGARCAFATLLLCLLATPPQPSAAEPLTRCRLAIIGAGTPRTGSTHEVRLVRLALQHLGFAKRLDDAGYWNWPEHSHMPEAAAKEYRDKEQARATAWMRSSA